MDDNWKVDNLVKYAHYGPGELIRKFLSQTNTETDCVTSGMKTVLMTAIERHDLPALENLIAAGASVNQPGFNGNTALMFAAWIGALDCILVLRDGNCDVNQTNNAGETALMFASESGRIDVVNSLVSMGADVNLTSNEGMTALMFAAQRGHRVCVELFIRIGAHLDSRNNQGLTAVMMVSVQDNDACLDMLLQAGAHFNIMSNDSLTALMLASLSGKVQCVNILIRYGAHVDIVNKERRTALMLAAMEGRVYCLQSLIRAGSNINFADRDGFTAVMFATLHSHSHCVEYLWNCGADIDLRNVHRHDKRGDTVLRITTQSEASENVCLLYEASATGGVIGDSWESATIQPGIRMVALNNGYVSVQPSGNSTPPILYLPLTLIDAGVGGRTALTSKSRLQTSDYICSLLRPGTGINQRDETGNTVLMQALGSGHHSDQCLQALLRAGANPYLLDKNGRNALMLAAIIGQEDRLRLLLREGVNPNVANNSGDTALLHCARLGILSCIDILIQGGAAINLPNKNGTTPLMAAAIKGHLQCLLALIQTGANINITDKCGKTAFMLTNNIECLVTLVEAGTDVSLADNEGYTALMHCARLGTLDCIDILIQGGADVNLPSKNGTTPLMFAAIRGHLQCLLALIQKGANINITDKCGKTAFMLTTNRECLVTLVEAGINVSLADNDGYTALMHCARLGTLDCIDILIQGGADVNLPSKNGTTSLMFAAIRGHLPCLRALVQRGANTNIADKSGKTAVMLTSNRECLMALVEAGADVNLADNNGDTALMHAVYTTGPITYVESLIACDSRVNIQNKNGQTALMLACDRSYGHERQYVSQLLRAGAQVNLTDRSGWTALMFAADNNDDAFYDYFDTDEYSSSAIVSELVNAGAEIDMKENDGKTALMIAAANQNPQCLRALVLAGANVNNRDNNGKTALIHVVQFSQVILIDGENSWDEYWDSDYDERDAVSAAEVLIDSGVDVNAQDDRGMTAMMYVANEHFLFHEAEDLIDRLVSRGTNLELSDINGCTALVYALKRDVNMHGSARKAIRLLEREAYPLLEQSLRPWLHRYFKSIHSYPQRYFFSVKCGIRFCLCNGVIQNHLERVGFDSHRDVIHWTPFHAVMSHGGSLDVAKYLIANCFVTSLDMEQMRNGRSSTILREDVRNFLRESVRHPWPLVKLAFIAVSTALGPSPEREERARQTGLPVPIQECLLFQRPVALLHHDWDEIPMVFRPDEYVELPQPYPLLYNWPFGHWVVDCECSTCKVKDDQFKLKCLYRRRSGH